MYRNYENSDVAKSIFKFLQELTNLGEEEDVNFDDAAVDVDGVSCLGKHDILEDVRSVIYNEPATIVTFADGSKVCVKASAKDPFNKEIGLMYAIVKRMYANDIDSKSGYLRATGLGEKINRLVDGAYDQKEQERIKRAERKAKAKAKQEEEEAEDVKNAENA